MRMHANRAADVCGYTHGGMPTKHMCLLANALNNVVDPASVHMLATVSAHMHGCGYTHGPKTLLGADGYTCGCIRTDIRMYADTNTEACQRHICVYMRKY